MSVHVTMNHFTCWSKFDLINHNISEFQSTPIVFVSLNLCHCFVILGKSEKVCTFTDVQLGCFFFLFSLLKLNSLHDRWVGVFLFCFSGTHDAFVFTAPMRPNVSLKHWSTKHFGACLRLYSIPRVKWAKMSFFDCLHIKIHFSMNSRLIRWQLQKPYFCKQVELQTETLLQVNPKTKKLQGGGQGHEFGF